MAQRRPITSHPAFAPFLALWFAALFGLTMAVLPGRLLESALAMAGLDALVPLTVAGRGIACAGAALIGALLGLALALPLARRGRRDPRPVYSEPEGPVEHPIAEEPARRPLSVREELAEDPAAAPGDSADEGVDGSGEDAATELAWPAPGSSRVQSPPATSTADEGFMILTPQPAHPPSPAPDLDSLIEQFDTALAAFRSDNEPRPAKVGSAPDPVHAFIARQTSAPAAGPVLSPLVGRMPDHQAELRAALDKLARAHRKD